MKMTIASILLVLPALLQAAEISANSDSPDTTTVVSPVNRVAVLELYTSEGCSSCPPADRFLSGLKQAGISDRQLIPMAFHVTYWDYIGWSDRFADRRYDQRQRDIAQNNRQSSIYTPQFVLSGDDFRRYKSFNKEVNAIVSETSRVDIRLSMTRQTSEDPHHIKLNLESDLSRNGDADVALYLAILEDSLSSEVNDGENEGETLSHDYVVRKLLGPYTKTTDRPEIKLERELRLSPEWKKDELSVIAFVEDKDSGEVLQAVRLDY